MYRWPEYVPRGSLCAYDGSSYDSDSGRADGSNSGGPAGPEGGRDEGDRGRAAQQAGIGGYGEYSTPYSEFTPTDDTPVTEMTPQLARQLGIQTPEEVEADVEAGKVARTFVDLLSYAVPGMGLLMGITDYATRKGYTVEAAAPPSNPSAGMLGGLYGPRETVSGLPNSASALASMPSLPGETVSQGSDAPFLPGSFPALSLYSGANDSAAAAGSVAALGPTNGAETAAAASTAEKTDLLPLLAISAGLMVALSL